MMVRLLCVSSIAYTSSNTIHTEQTAIETRPFSTLVLLYYKVGFENLNKHTYITGDLHGIHFWTMHDKSFSLVVVKVGLFSFL